VEVDKMDHRELAISIFWAGIGILFCAGSLSYGLTGSGSLGAGMLPFFSGLILLVLSILHFVQSLIKAKSQPLSKPSAPDFPIKEKLKRVSIVLCALAFYVVALERLGFATTSFIFMATVIGLDFKKWPMVALSAGFFTVFFYILFKVLLKVPLPQGLLGI
jgi:putative tricarboxylic transport membrane protein